MRAAAGEDRARHGTAHRVEARGRIYDSITDTLSLSGSYRSTAVNLFGKLGRHPRFPWYRSEEIGHSLGYSGIVPLTGETGKNEERHTISAGQLLELTISERSSLGMKNNWEVLLPEEEHGIDSTLYWERRRPVEWDIPFRERLKANRQFLQHREEVDFSWKEEPAAEETRFSLLFAHTSELRIPETGFFRVFGRLGYSRVLSSTEGDPLGRNTLALEIGAETELQF